MKTNMCGEIKSLGEREQEEEGENEKRRRLSDH